MVADKRGPKIGDAASLWNFTPSPGWTKEEAHILKLCLIKFGIGRWVQILDLGLLPGKLIQQLNGQTQRLLGQQSLAAYTGLQVDIDRIRADNEARTDAPRKAGLIINTGPNLTKEMKEKLQEESRTKYGLTPEQIKAAETELEELAAKLKRTASDSLDPSTLTTNDTTKLPSLLESDATKMSKEEKLALLNALHKRMQSLTVLLDKKSSHNDNENAPSPDSNQENKASNSAGQGGVSARRDVGDDDGDVDMNGGSGMRPITAATLAKAHRRRPGATTTTTTTTTAAKNSTKRTKSSSLVQKEKSTNKRQASAMYDSDNDDNDDGGCENAEHIARQSDVETLIAMGFSKKQADEALDEADGSVEGAAEWLMMHCI